MSHLYTYTCTDMILYLIYIYETVFFLSQCYRFYLSLYFFLPTIHRELFNYLQVLFFISVDISKVYVMSSPRSQSSPAFHSFFNKEKKIAETATKLDFISYIWDDDYIRKLDEKNGNTYGVIKSFKESILLSIFLAYWGRKL